MSKVIAAGATALFACNSPLASLLARGKRVVVRGQRVSGDWSSPHSNERCGR